MLENRQALTPFSELRKPLRPIGERVDTAFDEWLDSEREEQDDDE